MLKARHITRRTFDLRRSGEVSNVLFVKRFLFVVAVTQLKCFPPNGRSEIKHCISFTEAMESACAGEKKPDGRLFVFSCTLSNLTWLAWTKRKHETSFLKEETESWILPQMLHPEWHVCITSTSCISVIRRAPGLGRHHTMPRLAWTAFFLCVCVGYVQKQWQAEGERQDTQIKRERLFFYVSALVRPSHHHHRRRTCNVTHIVARNTISCSKPEVKNNISHRNLGSGESCLTGTADYWCIFNKVKDLQCGCPFRTGAHVTFLGRPIPGTSATVRRTGRARRMVG